MPRKQIALFGFIFAAVLVGLAVLYLLFIRSDYSVLFADIREQETAEVVAELDRMGIDYRIEDGGHRILVPEVDEDEARVAIAGSDIALGGVVGFELFNESDMGLTEFAQQVNYQRALQGELARTIMMSEGIAFSRVHISLPERSLFRSETIGPKAAVTVQPNPGYAIGGARVRGIQLLVASAVSGLEADDVSVLDEHDRLISPEPGTNERTVTDLDEKGALEAYFRARADAAAAPMLAGIPHQLRVSAIRLTPASSLEGDDQTDPAPGRDFALAIAVRTEFELAEADRADIREAVAQAVDLRPASGDAIRFEVADLAGPSPADFVPIANAEPEAAPVPGSAQPTKLTDRLAGLLLSRWALLALLVVLVAAAPILRQRVRMSQAERERFAEQLDSLLTQRRETGHG